MNNFLLIQNMDNLNRSGENILQMQETNLITLLKNPQKFRQTFYQLTGVASKSLKVQEYEKALKVLNKCVDMLDLGKNILKDISKYWKLCLNANLACAYQGTWKMQKCNKCCEKAEQQLQKLIQSTQQKENILNLNKCLIRLRFQHCAILSQLNQHEKALELCKMTLSTLEEYIKGIFSYSSTISFEQNSLKSSQTIQFSKQVSGFAEQILKNLLKHLTEPLTSKNDKISFYYWEKNPENNEEQVKKKFVPSKSNDECKRSILGVNKMTHWIDEFNIGTIMHMSELSVKDFESPLPVQQYIFKDKLYETVIYCSVAHFTIATEMRFIESNKDKDRDGQQKEKQKEKQNSEIQDNRDIKNSSISVIQGPNTGSIIKKYGFKEKTEMFMLSELYHLRAIHIIAENIKTTVPYISHLIKSYDKHYIYKKQLEPVVAIEEESLLSMEFNSFKPNNKEQRFILKEDVEQDEQENNFLYEEKEPINSSIIKKQQEEFIGFQSLKNAKIVQSSDFVQKTENMHIFQPKYGHESDKKQKRRNKSQKMPKIGRQKTKSKFQKGEEGKKGKKQKVGKQGTKVPKGKELKKKKENSIERQVRINHQSCTQIKVVVFKKKK